MLLFPISVFPPVSAVVEDGFAAGALALAEERDLVADSELYVFANVLVGLCEGLQIHVVPDAVFDSEADVVPVFLASRSVGFVEKRQLMVMTIFCVIHLVVVAGKGCTGIFPIQPLRSRHRTGAHC